MSDENRVRTAPRCAHCLREEGGQHHPLCKQAVPQRQRTTMPVWFKGLKDREGGLPARHPKAKALLLLRGASLRVWETALLELIDRDPLPVLTALANAAEAEDALWAHPCEVNDCKLAASPCACGAAHCKDHPHVS